MLVLTVQEDDITDSGGRGGVWYRTVLMVHVGAVLIVYPKVWVFFYWRWLVVWLAGCHGLLSSVCNHFCVCSYWYRCVLCCSQVGCVGGLYCIALGISFPQWCGCLATTVPPTVASIHTKTDLLCFLPTDLSSIPFSAHRVISHDVTQHDDTGFPILVPNDHALPGSCQTVFMIITSPLGLSVAKYSS